MTAHTDVNRLNPMMLKHKHKLTPNRRYSDGNGLWLQVSTTRTLSWVFRYTLKGQRRVRWMGLGPLSALSLAEARERAVELRKNVKNGIDPIEQEKVDRTKGVTFKEVAEDYIKGQSAGWKNPKHRQQWKNTLETYAYPVLGDKPVSTIDKHLVMKVLKPIWNEKTETADRVRQRIVRILESARFKGAFTGENPARWIDNLEHSELAAPSDVAPVQNHPALPFEDIPKFMAALRARNSTSARALEFTILTAVRTGATIGAVWSEFDFEKKLWTVSPERAGVKMKLGSKPKVTPLSDRAIEILEMFRGQRRPNGAAYVFPGDTPNEPLSNMAMLELLRGMLDKQTGVTVHGFRSTFKDWASESTDPVYDDIVSEMALWHAIRDKTEKAYRRGVLLERRKEMMNHWARYCGSASVTGKRVIRQVRRKVSV